MRVVYDEEHEELDSSYFRSSDENKYCLFTDQAGFNNNHFVFESHWHEWLEITYIIDGEMDVEAPDGIYHVGKGEVIVIGMQTLHKIVGSTGNYRYQCLHVNIGFILQHINLALLMEKILLIKDVPTFLKYFSETISLLTHNDVVSQLNFKASLLKVLAACLEESGVDLTQYEENNYSDVFSRILFYVGSHFQENLSLQEIADEFDYTVQHISLMFKKNLGTNYHTYLTKLRLDKARFLLTTTQKRVLDIAYECGFPSEHSLINQFKKFYQITPAKYRLQEKNKSMQGGRQ